MCSISEESCRLYANILTKRRRKKTTIHDDLFTLSRSDERVGIRSDDYEPIWKYQHGKIAVMKSFFFVNV